MIIYIYISKIEILLVETSEFLCLMILLLVISMAEDQCGDVSLLPPIDIEFYCLEVQFNTPLLPFSSPDFLMFIQM